MEAERDEAVTSVGAEEPSDKPGPAANITLSNCQNNTVHINTSGKPKPVIYRDEGTQTEKVTSTKDEKKLETEVSRSKSAGSS
ncbi:hypothetical protein [Notoacmeibacter ruber]|uniref:Uncharacterized protein n=1 Tax=Notoacmeibacter ruber TaxID=2670375 RepID=A0A3L7J3K7_9HYPH|nr:hypothetical protein [Notoacmeibacter ruber]RLQ85228.1 hypothetical protein D8780_14795 [Notoacmeibacter ruber]